MIIEDDADDRHYFIDAVKELGASGFITKPIDLKKLPQLIISKMKKANQIVPK